MTICVQEDLKEQFNSFIAEKAFPCTGAKAALGKEQVYSMVAGDMRCPAHDGEMLSFLYDFS